MQTTKKKRRGKETLNTQTLRQKSSNGELRRQTHSVLKYSIDYAEIADPIEKFLEGARPPGYVKGSW